MADLIPNGVNNYKVTYTLYDYSEKCKIGYGGTAYYKGYIVFNKTFLSIEDHEIDRDDWDDAWHGSHRKHIISSDKYHEIINVLHEMFGNNHNEQDLENEIARNTLSLLDTEIEKTLFKSILYVIKIQNESLKSGRKLVNLICTDKITYHIIKSQSDDFYPDSDTLNYDNTEIINGI
jgi:hypothetical protein